ncbi:response regulator [Anaeromyxobacter paludicola]|uniref:Response regulatory domain-containing protein n=1 Tax=Anaeromyxobacter paludicola TaxID=2918171 RepID=A0ABM7XDD3_9BACT|nr:response regulator [Anaeromyxobacter paludicola]BDG09879.1 hypothetical protein AMPC_29920 [Anaeromyxobacter paludicola]
MPSPRVLIVDDSQELRSALSDTLRASGFEASTASDGAEALRTIEDGARPDVILLDLLMPGMDGAQFLEQLRASPKNRDIAIVVVTGVASAHVRKLLQADAFLFKPFTPDELTSVVRRVHERSRPPR